MRTLLRPYEGTQPYIFVSYAHKNDAAVLEIIGTLQSRGFRVWYDEGIEAGSEWPESIASHLERAQLVHERVERAVRDRGRIEGVIEIAVVLDLATERLDTRRRITRLSSQFLTAEQILLFFGHTRPLYEQGPGHAGA